jgi:CRP-like cAMP-binding protein
MFVSAPTQPTACLRLKIRGHGHDGHPFNSMRLRHEAETAGLSPQPRVPVQRTLPTRLGPAVGGTSQSGPDPLHNHLLAALPEADYARIAAHLELSSLLLGEVLYESGGQLQHAYFPTSAIISLQYVCEDGSSAEIAGVGNEGMLGISLFMGGNTTPSSAVVQTAGHGYRMPARLLLEEFNRGGPMLRLLLRYSQALITQMTQTGVCNRHHSVAQQLCRWLLLTLDRLPSNDLVMTQELIASMLGVRRESVTEAAGQLKERGVIGYRRGHITVLDRSGLEAHVCECYQVVKVEYDRLLRDVQPH